jgi:hypothetical protein
MAPRYLLSVFELMAEVEELYELVVELPQNAEAPSNVTLTKASEVSLKKLKRKIRQKLLRAL